MHVRVNMHKNLDKARSESNDALRNLNIQKRHNSDLKRRIEELLKELQLSKANRYCAASREGLTALLSSPKCI